MRNVWLTIAITAGIVLPQSFLLAQSDKIRTLINRFLVAAQKHDYSTSAKLIEQFKMEEIQIKGENPRSLWPSLLADFWKQKAEDLEHRELKPSSIPGSDHAFFDEGDDGTIHTARELFELISPSARWSVSEVRPRPSRLSSGLSWFDVYVSLSYPSKDGAPSIVGKVLKKTILACTVAMGPMFETVQECNRFEKGDVYWPESQ
jgi:hypothetical protein